MSERSSAVSLILSELAYEFDSDIPRVTDLKIRRALRRRGLGFDPELVNRLRDLKNDLQSELRRPEQSDYFLGYHGAYSSSQDFDVERLTADCIRRYPQLPPTEIEHFVPFALYLYSLR